MPNHDLIWFLKQILVNKNTVLQVVPFINAYAFSDLGKLNNSVKARAIHVEYSPIDDCHVNGEINISYNRSCQDEELHV